MCQDGVFVATVQPWTSGADNLKDDDESTTTRMTRIGGDARANEFIP